MCLMLIRSSMHSSTYFLLPSFSSSVYFFICLSLLHFFCCSELLTHGKKIRGKLRSSSRKTKEKKDRLPCPSLAISCNRMSSSSMKIQAVSRSETHCFGACYMRASFKTSQVNHETDHLLNIACLTIAFIIHF